MAQNRRPENQGRHTDGRDNRIVQYGEVRNMSRSRSQQSASRGRSQRNSSSQQSREEKVQSLRAQSRNREVQSFRTQNGNREVQGSRTQSRHPQNQRVQSTRSQDLRTQNQRSQNQRSQHQRNQDPRLQKQRSQNQRPQNNKSRNAVYSQQGKKRRRKRRSKINGKLIVILTGVFAFLVLLGYLETVLFQTKSIEVTGNHYATDAEVTEWIKSDKFSNNSLYVLWKYNRDDVSQLPAVKSVQVKLKSPQKVIIHVKEKTFSGRVDCKDGSLYFDRDGIASLQTQEVIEGVTYITGIDIQQDKVVMGKILPVKDKKVFKNINDVSEKLKEYDLVPDKISCENSELTLCFGNVRVRIGNGNYDEKLVQIPPILAKMKESYSDQTGTVHLENYDKTNKAIRFVPEPITDPAGIPENTPDTGSAENTDAVGGQALPQEQGDVSGGGTGMENDYSQEGESIPAE